MLVPECLAIIAGNGSYPLILAQEARKAGVKRIVAAAFLNETKPELAPLVDDIATLRVGQLGALLKYLEKSGASAAIMAGQIAPKNLFDLRPDIKALFVLAKLKERNAESIFGAIAAECAQVGVPLLPATTFMDAFLAPKGHFAGPAPNRRLLEDFTFGLHIAKEVSRLDIGQTVVVKKGTVLAVEGFEGTNAAILRGGELGRGEATVIKVSKPNQDLRFDVPVIGPATLETAHTAGIHAIAVEAGQTLLLEKEKTLSLASEKRITLCGL
jgi:DUF1009 family protein